MEFLYFLSQYRSAVGDVLVQGITTLAQETVVIAILCWLFWCADKRLAYTLGFSYFTSGLLVQGLKITFRVPRPWVLDPTFEPVASAVPGATSYSFPSGHTQSITALMGTLGLHARKKAGKIFCFLIIAAVMFSRMYLGVHTPQDVCVSFIISFLCVLLTYTVFYRNRKAEGNEKIISIIMMILCIGLSVYAVTLKNSGIIAIDYAEDCIKAAGAGIAFSIGYYIETHHIRFLPPANFKAKILRLIVGLVIALLIQKGLKPVIGTSLPASFIRYFLVVFWIVVVYPLIFSKRSKTHA